MNLRIGMRLKAIALTIALMAPASSALATQPGQNGRIAYSSNATASSPTSIFLTGLGQLVTPSSSGFDRYPAWSPDGNMLAFVHLDASGTISIEVCQKDGTGERAVLSVNGQFSNPAVPLDTFTGFSYPAWTPDGNSITFVSTDFPTSRLYTVRLDGTGLTEIVGPEALRNGSLDVLPDQPSWSPQGILAFLCNPGYRKQSLEGGTPHAICVFTPASQGSLPFYSELSFQPDNLVDPASPAVTSVKWMPDGQSLLFAGAFHGADPSGSAPAVDYAEVFRINPDGTGLVQITHSAVARCPSEPQSGVGTMQNLFAAPSPDGQSIVTYGYTFAFGPPLSGSVVCNATLAAGYWTANADGTSQSLLLSVPNAGTPIFGIDWQPITQGLAFQILDGHLNPLKGMKVELHVNNATQDLIDASPINTTGGTYVFQDPVVHGQQYLLRATLTDACADPCSPAFEIHYAPTYSGTDDPPVSMDWLFTVSLSQLSSYILNFDSDQGDNPDAQVSCKDICADAGDRMADMADIYFRVRQYVDWVHSHLAMDTRPTARFFTFALDDGTGGNSIDPVTNSGSGRVFYHYPDQIVIGAPESRYAARDQVSDPDPTHNGDAPENVEWHEFTHHIFEHLASQVTPCVASDANHAGYDNSDTCDSLDEGFAAFLPTLAGQDILGYTDAMYAGFFDLETDTKAWSSRLILKSTQLTWTSAEDFAVASLFWDLTDANADSEQVFVNGVNGASPLVTYTDQISIPVSLLWAKLTSEKPRTVADVALILQTYLSQPLTIDLDGDGVPDVSPLDEVFLMHGFFPVDREDTTPAAVSQATRYDVGYFMQYSPSGGRRDGWVGYSSHHQYNSSGTLLNTFHPRSNIPLTPNANLQVHILDLSGAPITSGATVNLTITYPEVTETLTRAVTGDGALVPLELPSYFDYYVPPGSPLPPCDPLHDVHVNVVVSAQAGGQNSTQTQSFDNCAYIHAIAAATGPVALSFTFTVPIVSAADGAPPITTLALSPAPNGAGWNNANVTATLTAADNAGGSGVKQLSYSATGAQPIPVTTVPASTATFGITAEGQTTVTFFATDNAGNTESPNTSVIAVDKTAPAVACGGADGNWHATDVSISCTSSDSLSGLANPPDSSFALTTSVPAGTEIANATTGSRVVCDVAGNCATAGPVSGNMVDEKPPMIVVAAPAAGSYALNQVVMADYACTDGGSGVAACAGSAASGAAIDTTSVGSRTFTVNAADNVGNAASPQVIAYSVGYKVCILFDPKFPVPSGAIIPLAIQLCDAHNKDVSRPSIVVHATTLIQSASDTSLPIRGFINFHDDFLYSRLLGPTGGYIFNLGTKGLSAGSYVLSFTAGADPAPHELTFQVR